MSNAVTAKYRNDYQTPHFYIDELYLDVALDAKKTHIKAVSNVRANTDNPSDNLVLDGVDLTLDKVLINDTPFNDYELGAEQLTLKNVPAEFTLEIHTFCSPSTNTSLEGLYLSDGAYCTQCEAEGFRKITYFLDRPDVMAQYTVRIEADKAQFPYLLSNGNKIDSGELADGKHFALWQDPYKKPSYLFALVAGDFDVLRDTYTTTSEREVALELYVDKGNLSKAPHAMESLKKAMQWDEQRFNLEYDLDVYMIVAVDFFNMGAMENKGLNVFNSKCVLANEQTSTDRDFHMIESIVGHEYFHNWTGNRVTCRDWFQLSLKEGLTVFRDQEFSSDLGSRALNRIDAVKVMRTHQFAEDSGPMAHPIRPDKVIEMNNFYTVTVYDKGAEVIRMLHTLLGEQGFQKGMQLYIERHDGQAVTCDDFVNAMSDANAFDLSLFKLWYSQSGTPKVTIEQSYDEAAKQLHIKTTQHTPPTPDQQDKQALLIPMAIEILDHDGKATALTYKGQVIDKVLRITQAEQTFTFDNIAPNSTLVAFEDFSAPVKVEFEQSLEQLLHIMRFASSDFSRWDAMQSAWNRAIKEALSTGDKRIPTPIIEAIQALLAATQAGQESDLALIAELIKLPSFDALSSQYSPIDVDGLLSTVDAYEQQLSDKFAEQLSALLVQFKANNSQDSDDVAKRALMQSALHYLAKQTNSQYLSVVEDMVDNESMTLSVAALRALVLCDAPSAQQKLAQFESRWNSDVLVMDKWMNVQAMQRGSQAIANIEALYEHAHFSWQNPNRVRALLGVVCMANPSVFHEASGQGYKLLCDALIKLNDINPQNASRLLTPLLAYKQYDAGRQALMKAQLERLAALPNLSKDLFEKVDKALA